VVLQILPNSGHCQCLSTTRKLMWDAIDAWIADKATPTSQGL
jgi:hypothetical protein